MKKSLVLALVVSFVLSVAGTAFAFPVDFNGSFKYEFRQNKDFGTIPATINENRFYTDLSFTGKIDDQSTFFARFAGQVKDRQSAGESNQTNNFTLDKFGVKTVTGNVTWALGRQGATLGQGGMFYSGVDVDPLNYFDGVVATTKLGDFNVKVIGGKTVDNAGSGQGAYAFSGFDPVRGPIFTRVPAGSQDWVGIDFTVPAGGVTLGAAFANKNDTANGTDAKYWGLNFATKIGSSVDFSGEYVKSNASTDNKAYTFAGTYSWDKDSFTVAYNHVQAYGVDSVSSVIGTVYYPNGTAFNDPTYAFGYKGFTYAYHHSFTKAMGFNAYLLSLKPLSGANVGHTNNELGLNMKWSF